MNGLCLIRFRKRSVVDRTNKIIIILIPKKIDQGWKILAAAFKDVDVVVGMSLRNELRGPGSNPSDWYKYMQAAAEAVHAANPHVLVILSGLNYDANLKFLVSKPVNLGFSNKIMYEMHWYSFTDRNAWMTSNANQLCGTVTARINDHAAFIVKRRHKCTIVYQRVRD